MKWLFIIIVGVILIFIFILWILYKATLKLESNLKEDGLMIMKNDTEQSVLNKLRLNELKERGEINLPGIELAKLQFDEKLLEVFLKKYEVNSSFVASNNSYHNDEFNSSFDYNYDSYNVDWGLGDFYEKELDLNDDELALLNKIDVPRNKFFNVDFCAHEIIKLFLKTIKALEDKFVSENSTLTEQLELLADLITGKKYKWKNDNGSYHYMIGAAIDDIYYQILRECENTVRKTYRHKRLLPPNANYTKKEAVKFYKLKFLNNLDEIWKDLIPTIAPPNEETEIILNKLTITRWKIKLNEIKELYGDDPSAFVDEIIILGAENIKNPSVEKVFFEASKFIAKKDREAALKLYIYYLHWDLNSATFDNKKLTKTIQKSLFKTKEELYAFEAILSDLIEDRDLNKALKAVTQFYVKKRKKISLDESAIIEVKEKHSSTVNLLNEFLQDEHETENTITKTKELNSDEVSIEITAKANAANKVSDSVYLDDIELNNVQLEVLSFFVKNNFTILQSDFNDYAKEKGLFKNQIIDSLNENCYEVLDDVLIEEEEDSYTILEPYYKKILKDDKSN